MRARLAAAVVGLIAGGWLVAQAGARGQPVQAAIAASEPPGVIGGPFSLVSAFTQFADRVAGSSHVAGRPADKAARATDRDADGSLRPARGAAVALLLQGATATRTPTVTPISLLFSEPMRIDD